MKKKLSIFLALIMILCMIPVNVFAVNNTVKPALSNDKGYEEATIDGVAYKVYNVADFMDEITKEEIISHMSKSTRGTHYTTQNTPTQTSKIKFVLNLKWSTVDRPIETIKLPVYVGPPSDSRSFTLGYFEVKSVARPGVEQRFEMVETYTGDDIDDLVKYAFSQITIAIPEVMRYDFILASAIWDSKQPPVNNEVIFTIEGTQSVMHGFGIKWYDTDAANREKIDAKWGGLVGQELPAKLATVDRNYSSYYANKIDRVNPGRLQHYPDGSEYTPFDYYYNGEKITTCADAENQGKFDNNQLAIGPNSDRSNAKLTVDGKRDGSKILKNNTKYLYHSVGDYRTFHVLSMREALKVKFNTGKGSLTKGGDANQEIGKAQEIGHSEKIKGNESGREIEFPTDKLIPPEKADGQTTENEFIGWNTDDKATEALTQDELDALTFTEKTTTFYAIYKPADDYHVKVEYVDESKTAIKDIYKLDDQTYPDTQSGDKDQEIKAEHKDKNKAPKFLGYKIKDVEVTPAVTGEEKQVYTTDGKYTVNFIYEKLDPIIPEDDASDEVKNTYKKVTIKVDGNKGKFQKNNNDVTGTEFVYYVNPVEGKTLDDVKTASGLTPKSKDENANKIDANKPWTFTPDKTKADTPADVALGTEVNKDNFKGVDNIVMEVNFGQTIAEKFKNKLKDKDIKVWKGDDITWKDGVELKTADEDLQKILDDTKTSYADASTPVRTSGTARKAPFEGTIKITFSDNSTIEVPNQKLYVSEEKVEVKDPSDPDYIDPENLPKDKVKIEIKLGEGVKEAKKNGKEGNAANPVLIKTFYVKPGTGLEAADFPSTSGNNAEIVKQDNYKDPITWNPSNLTQTWSKDGVYVASAESAQCKTPQALQAAFEEAIDPMFENIKKKDGVYLGKYDKANKKVTVAIIDKTKSWTQLKGTGLVAGLKDLLKNHNLIKYQVGNQPVRDLKAIEKASADEQTLVNNLAQLVGLDMANEIAGNGGKIKTLADFIGKKITLKLTVQEPDCEANAVTLTYTIEGKEAIASILKGKLTPQDIKVWKGDKIDWEKGVKKDEIGLTAEQKEQIKDEFSTYDNDGKKTNAGKAKFEDDSTPARNSDTAKAEPFVGTIKVTFSDGSELLVENQNLYVSEIMTGGNNENAPDDAITVTFQLGKGVKAKKGATDVKGAETPVVYETYKVKPDTNLDTYKLATGKNIFDNINAESMDKEKYSDVAWTPTNHVVTKTNNVFTANATEAFIMKHTFKLFDKDDKNKEITELPQVLKDKLALLVDKKVVKDATYAPEKQADIKEVKEGDKLYDYSFVKWDPASAKNEDKTFVGTWYREQSTSKTPRVVTPKEGDKTIGGDGEPGSKIIVKTPDGKEYDGEVDKDGKWTVDIPEAKDGDDYIVTQIEKGKKESKEVPVHVRKKGNIEVEYPTSEIYVGDYKTVTPEIYGTSTTETDEAPFVVNRRKLEDMGVTVKAHSDGRLTIEIGENYRGPKRFTIDLDVYVDGQEIATYADVIVLEAKTRRPEAAVKTDDREIHEHKAYIFGYPDGSVRPQGNITRAEAAAMIARLLNIEAFGSNTKPMFPDTPSAWYNRAINAVVQRGIMKGYPDGSFKPNDPITRAEFTTMIAAIDNKAYGVAPFADVKGHWAELAIGREYQAGRINGYPDGTFRPQRHITRAEAATILNKIFDRCYDAMSLIGTERKENVRIFTDLYQGFWGYNDMVEATNNHSFKRRVEGRVEEDWVMVK